MSEKERKSFSSDFKAKVALEAAPAFVVEKYFYNQLT